LTQTVRDYRVERRWWWWWLTTVRLFRSPRRNNALSSKEILAVVKAAKHFWSWESVWANL